MFDTQCLIVWLEPKILLFSFKTLGSLEVIQMPQNGIHHLGITALAESFASNKNLKVCLLIPTSFVLIL